MYGLAHTFSDNIHLLQHHVYQGDLPSNMSGFFAWQRNKSWFAIAAILLISRPHCQPCHILRLLAIPTRYKLTDMLVFWYNELHAPHGPACFLWGIYFTYFYQLMSERWWCGAAPATPSLSWSTQRSAHTGNSKHRQQAHSYIHSLSHSHTFQPDHSYSRFHLKLGDCSINVESPTNMILPHQNRYCCSP